MTLEQIVEKLQRLETISDRILLPRNEWPHSWEARELLQRELLDLRLAVDAAAVKLQIDGPPACARCMGLARRIEEMHRDRLDRMTQKERLELGL